MPCRLHFLQKKLKILFYSTTKNQLIFIIISRKVKQHQLLTVFIFYNDLWKTPQARLAILLLFMWLNLVKSIKLPTYPEEGSSHYVVQHFFFLFFFFMISFWMIFLVIFFFYFFFFKKWGLTCVILALRPMVSHGYQLRNNGYHH